MKAKGYIVYALGEILLIVLGILLAMYINKLNEGYQYRKKIDKNLNRVYTELEKNLEKTGSAIASLQAKDSLINLFMNNQLTKRHYKENVFLSALIFNSHTLEIEEDAFHNLIQLNISDNKYQDTLINKLKAVYSLNKKIKVLNEKLSDFVYQLMLNQKADIFGRFAYDGTVSDKLIDYFLSSKEYRSQVTLYTTLAIRNQLSRYQNFYTEALGTYKEISKQYDLPNQFSAYIGEEIISTLMGAYGTTQDSVSLNISYQNDSIILAFPSRPKIHLIPYAKHRLYWSSTGLGYFVSFFPNDSTDTSIRLQRLAYTQAYQKLDSAP